MQTEHNQEMIRVPTVAKLYDIGKSSVWKLIREGKLKAYRPSNGIALIKKSDIEDLIMGVQH
jgi:excisionase family DNA binding protein